MPAPCTGAACLLTEDASLTGAQYELLHLAGRRLRQFVDEADPLRRLEVRNRVAHVQLQVFLCRLGALPLDDEGMRRLAPPLMWHADHGDLLHRGMS